MQLLSRPVILTLLALTLALPFAALAQDDAHATSADREFFRALKRAALADDRAWIVAHTCLPVRATIDGRSRLITSASELAAAFPAIMTLDTLTAIRRQSPDTLVRTRRGVMIGDGELWFDVDPTAPASGQRHCIIAFGNTE